MTDAFNRCVKAKSELNIGGNMNRLSFGLLAATIFVGAAISNAPAHAATTKKSAQQVKYCNELPYDQCVKCAISRGYSPKQYGPYCSNRR